MHSLTRREWLCETRKASFKGCSACRNFSKKDLACEDDSPWGTLIKNVGVTWKVVEFLARLLCWWGCGIRFCTCLNSNHRIRLNKSEKTFLIA